jgi:large subunit ribosomal protein L13
MKTAVVNEKSITRKWYVIDASEMILGRLASNVALLLSGKGKPAYSPNQDHGDYVIIINSDSVRLSGNKADKKQYFRHSRYPGGGKFRSFKEQMALDSTKVIQDAVHGMLPKTTLGRKIISKLHVYKGDSHPHAAQKPEPLSL